MADQAWISRAELKWNAMTRRDISADHIFGLLDEISFVERLFWQLEPGILVTIGGSARAIGQRFGYPGHHQGVSLEYGEKISDWFGQRRRTPIYLLRDVERAQPEAAEIAIKMHIPNVIDILDDVYPRWCVSGRISGQRAAVETAIIVAPERSGSTYLANLLAATGQTGQVREHLRHHGVALTRSGSIDLVDWFQKVANAGMSADEIFATKVIHTFLAASIETMTDTQKQSLIGFFRKCRIIRIERKDAIARAASTYIAEQTGVWHVRNAAERRKLDSKCHLVELNLVRMREIFDRQRHSDSQISTFLDQVGEADLVLDFDDIVSNGPECAARIVELAGGDANAAADKLRKKPVAWYSSQSEVARRLVPAFQSHLDSIDEA